MNSDIEVEFEQAKDLLDRVSQPLRFVGLWPTDHTLTSNIRFAIAITYFSTHVLMEYWDFITVFGDLEQMVLNLMETTLQTIIMIRVLMLKFNKLVQQVIVAVKENVVDENYRNLEEKKIYIQYSATGAYFYKVSLWFTIISAIAWYTTPLQNYILSQMNNKTAILGTPYRIHTFVDTSSFERTVIVYIYQIGMNYSGICFVTSFSVIVVAITNVCGQLAVLSHRIKNLTVNDQIPPGKVFHDLVQEHLKVIRKVQTIDNAFNLAFLYELVTITVLISLIAYNTLMNFDDAEAAGLLSSASFTVTMMLFVYGNCMMGEFFKQESTKLLDAYYQCNWYEMPNSYKKSFIIGMIRAQIPLQLTAGKFYTYSMSNFTSIIKTSMAYVSMLRTVT